jgi:hypothetical protein
LARRDGGAISVCTGSGKSTATGWGSEAQAPKKTHEIALKPNFDKGLMLSNTVSKTGFMKHLTAYS